MNQLTLFATAEAPAAPAEQPSPPARYERDRELEARVEQRTADVIAGRIPMLETLRRAAAGYFHSRCDGETYQRDPGLKITIPAPAATDGEPVAKLVIYPGTRHSYGGPARQVTVDAEWINLLLVHLIPRDGKAEWRERITLNLEPEGKVRKGQWHSQTSDVDAERLCTAAARFLEDPQAAVAGSGTHCAICRKELTDPNSRARGIGPECFERWGDFLRFITPAPSGDQAAPLPAIPWRTPSKRARRPRTRTPATTKPLVTLYALNIYGQVFKHEARLHSHGRTDSMATNYLNDFGGGVPYVRLLGPHKRNPDCYSRDDGISRYLLLLEGTGHPDPIRLRQGDEDNARRDFRLLDPWEALINAHIAQHNVKVLADYRDIINDPKLRRAILESERRWGKRERPDLADMAGDVPDVSAVHQEIYV